jgi:hypothetical protein
MIRFSKEAEQPPAAVATGANHVSPRQVSLEGDSDNLRVTVDIGDDADITGASAPMSPRPSGTETLGEVV